MALLVCDKCLTLLPGAVINHDEMVACPGCFAPLQAQVFPAYFHAQVTGAAAEKVLSEEDASCFYHPAKKAVVPCSRCGRFLCALCDLDLGGNRHVCPGCLEAARREPAGKAVSLPGVLPLRRRVLHDQMALLLSLLPLTILGVYLSVITAPIALFLVIRYWNEPLSAPLPRTRARLIIAGFLALLQIGGWITLLVHGLNLHSHAIG